MEEDEDFVFKSDSAESMVSVTLGRVMNTLLTARPRKLNDAVSRLSADLRTTPPLGLLPFQKFHSLKSKDVKHSYGGQSMMLLNWLFQDEFIFQAIATTLAKIIATKDDRFIALGWCILVRGLVEYESASDQFPMNGIRQRHIDLLKIFCSCILQLSRIMRKGSSLQDGFELPSRLAVSAADCFLVLTESLTKIPAVPSSRQKSSDLSAPNQRVAVLAASGDKKSSEVSNGGIENLLWDQLEEVIHLVQKLLARTGNPRLVVGTHWGSFGLSFALLYIGFSIAVERTGNPRRAVGTHWGLYPGRVSSSFWQQVVVPRHFVSRALTQKIVGIVPGINQDGSMLDLSLEDSELEYGITMHCRQCCAALAVYRCLVNIKV
ncbi:hypothetical protein TIFTF001_023899 [Ficus carica]|uniref:Uncharacterized protein n=1 Tax=Ficus carica TaxID=3494 RepID=A0AA88AVA3_FICCA|nr:hypothetical protein TIFTF001_023899 [Ficus carica]